MNLIIIGTDTGVGKTYVACMLIKQLGKKRVGVFKPFETGVSLKNGKRYPQDALKLQKAAGNIQKLDDICFYSLKLPASPYRAAIKEKIKINFNGTVKKIKNKSKQYDHNVVECAGGLLVPITKNKTNLDFIKSLGWPVIVVSEDKLGTINHTLLTLTVLRKNNIKVEVLYMNLKNKKDKKYIQSLRNTEQIKLFFPKIKINP